MVIGTHPFSPIFSHRNFCKWHFQVAHILLNVGSVFARNGEYERALVPWRHAIDMYKSAGLQDDHPKVKCALGNIEIARNLATIAKHKEVEKTVRRLEDY
uniref:Kinesin light chain n=1 Tax=Ditylum brightwellii TaxID=49249 RepID=A0A7S4WKA7_9STRA|mmetsp:Transcript_40408/g.61254  ORF Transcript_40408/g.61254 Transcript_40408/m.61254 type:complete len:100 (-) Transcript_40408:146-445(-)